MGNLINEPHRIFNTKVDAEKVAAALKSDDPYWTYEVSVDPSGSGRALINIYDEDGLFVRKL